MNENVRLFEVAHARSGDKGSGANIGLIAFTRAGYEILKREATAERVESYFARLGAHDVVRYELPKLGALNFVLPGVLGLGGSRSLRTDAQGKALGQALLEMEISVEDTELAAARDPEWTSQGGQA